MTQLRAHSPCHRCQRWGKVLRRAEKSSNVAWFGGVLYHGWFWKEGVREWCLLGRMVELEELEETLLALLGGLSGV